MNFVNFNSDSFEQFARALALQVLGDGVTTFGNGPDGGREAIFDGTVDFPSLSERWTGYGVVQAKFKERVSDTATEQKWVVNQLKSELKAWGNRARQPEYYLFVTNVVLTSGAGGGHERVKEILDTHTPKLKGWRVWDENQLVTFLAKYESLRKRFAANLTKTDLIELIAEAIRTKADVSSILTSFIVRELMDDRDARLNQAGVRAEEQTNLADVFVDLPVSRTPTSSGELKSGSLSMLAKAGERRLDPVTLGESRHSGQIPSRYVFIGGPGSGKSTLGQFYSQIHRAALLERVNPSRVVPAAQAVVSQLQKYCENRRIAWPRTPRYPVRIELRLLARELDANRDMTLSRYICERISGKMYQLTHEELRVMMTAVPWLLILDGLDEVPATSNRTRVLSEIEKFLVDCRENQVDLMVLESSRPDGYSNEFNDIEAQQLYLLPLSVEVALECARKYVSTRYDPESSRAKEVIQTLEEASANSLVGNLMKSPLQVSFLATVIIASGKPSDSRWQLFGDYYRIVYERELQKAVAPVLAQRREDIDVLHQRVGLLLQCRSEFSGGSNAELSSDEFRLLAASCLLENGLSEGELKSVVDSIVDALQRRLVFLVSQSPSKVGFELRSLQEYMAAACLVGNDSHVVVELLRKVGASEYWRNVALFVVGAMFSEPRFRESRDQARVVCQDLNLQRMRPEGLLLGSRLALGVLLSGAALRVPTSNKGFTEIALGLLDAVALDMQLVDDLASVYSDVNRACFERAVDAHLERVGEKALPVLRLLLCLWSDGVEWAKLRALQTTGPYAREWNIAFSERLSFLNELPEDQWEAWRKVVAVGGLVGIDTHELMLADYSEVVVPNIQPFSWMASGKAQVDLRDEQQDPSAIAIAFTSVVSAEYVAQCAAVVRWMDAQESLHADWSVFRAAWQFVANPSADTLSAALTGVGKQPQSSVHRMARYLPWPLAALMRASDSGTSQSLSLSARRGDWGSLIDWRSQEASFVRNEALSLAFAGATNSIPIAAGLCGFAVTTGSTEPRSSVANAIVRYVDLVRGEAIGRVVVSDFLFYFTCFGFDGLSPGEAMSLLSKVGSYESLGLSSGDFARSHEGWISACRTAAAGIDWSKDVVLRHSSIKLDVGELVRDVLIGGESVVLDLAAIWVSRGAVVPASICAVPERCSGFGAELLRVCYACEVGSVTSQDVRRLVDVLRRDPNSRRVDVALAALRIRPVGQAAFVVDELSEFATTASRKKEMREIALRAVQASRTTLSDRLQPLISKSGVSIAPSPGADAIS